MDDIELLVRRADQDRRPHRGRAARPGLAPHPVPRVRRRRPARPHRRAGCRSSRPAARVARSRAIRRPSTSATIRPRSSAGRRRTWPRAGGARASTATSPSRAATRCPAPMVLNMTVMEYLAHGWDLARATGQPIPYTEQEGADALPAGPRHPPARVPGRGHALRRGGRGRRRRPGRRPLRRLHGSHALTRRPDRDPPATGRAATSGTSDRAPLAGRSRCRGGRSGTPPTRAPWASPRRW